MTPELVAGNLAETTADRPPGPPAKPRLRRSERTADRARWRDVLPPVLQEAVADSEQAAAHAKLVERAEQAASKTAELRTAHAKAVETDRQAEASFAAGNAPG